jgi:hypothetical protein
MVWLDQFEPIHRSADVADFPQLLIGASLWHRSRQCRLLARNGPWAMSAALPLLGDKRK